MKIILIVFLLMDGTIVYKNSEFKTLADCEKEATAWKQSVTVQYEIKDYKVTGGKLDAFCKTEKE